MISRRRHNGASQLPLAQQQQQDLVIGQLETGEPVTFSLADFVSHLWAPGAPGTGKTSLLVLLVQWLITLGQGVCLIDPVGSAFNRITNWLSYFPEYAQNVIILSPTDTAPFFAGLNPLQGVVWIEDIHVHADLIADCIVKVHGGNRDDTPLLSRKSEEIAEPVSSGAYTFLEFPYFYQLRQSTARAKLSSHSQDEGIREEWREFEALSRSQKRDELGSIRNRLPRFTRNHAIRMTLGRTTRNIDIADVVENRKQLLINASPGRGILGRSHSYLLSCLALSFITAYMRSRSEEQINSHSFYVFLDEFHNSITPDISAALDELRNTSLRIGMFHQRFGQLLREDRDILDAVLTDSGIKAIFGRLAPEALSQIQPLLYMGRLNFHQTKYQTYSVDQEAVPHFYTLQELEHQKAAELYMQPNQHMTWKYLSDPPRRIKVADVPQYPRDETRRHQLIDTIIANHPEVYMHQDEIEAEIQARHKSLELPPDTEPESYLDPDPT